MIHFIVSFIFVLMHSQDIAAILAPVSLAVFMAMYAHEFTFPKRIPREVVFCIVLVVYVIANIVANNSISGIGFMQYIKSYAKIFYTLGLFFIFFFIRPSARLEEYVYPAAIYSACLVASVTLYSYLVHPISIGFLNMQTAHQLKGPLGGHNVTADSLAMPIIMYFLASIVRRDNEVLSPLKPKIQYTLMTVIILATFILAKSRGVSAGLLFAVGCMCLSRLWTERRVILHKLKMTKKTFRLLATLTIMAVIVIVVLQSRLEGLEEDPNVLTRLALWLRALNMFLISPLFGLGLGTFEQTNIVVDKIIPGLVAVKRSGTYLVDVVHGSVEGGLHAHNVYMQLLAELGLVGLVLVLGLFLVGIFRRLPDATAIPPNGDSEYQRVLAGAQFNKGLVVFLFIHLAVAGMAGGYTLTSPTSAWALYIAFGRLVRQQLYLGRYNRFYSQWMLRRANAKI